MTEAQRDYLADLAGMKGVQLADTDNYSVARASAKIDELKDLPDAVFDGATVEERARIELLTRDVVREMNRWGFERSAA